MDKTLRKTTNLVRSQEETWSCGTNSRLLFDVNVMLNLSNGLEEYRLLHKDTLYFAGTVVWRCHTVFFLRVTVF